MNNSEARTTGAILLPSFEASPAWNATFGMWRKSEYNFCAKALSHGFARMNTDTGTGRNLKTKKHTGTRQERAASILAFFEFYPC